MKNGISLQRIGDMDAIRYFDVLTQELKENKERSRKEKLSRDPNAVMLERGTIDGVFG